MIPIRAYRRPVALIALAAIAGWLSAADSATAPLPASDAYTAADAERWIARAEALDIAGSPAWRSLLLYAPGVRGWRSTVDDERFFLSRAGAMDAAAELRAQLRLLVAPRSPSASHAAERFPARTALLCERLGLDPRRLPVSGNAEFEAAWASFAPRSAALVFASSFISSPSSMFGHTFLAIRGRHQSDRLRQALNYAAQVDEGVGGLSYAFKGLCGGFPGAFSYQPYYEKLREYGDLESRDLWEYELDLTGDELRRLLMQVWELRSMRSDYWFFDENCAFALLQALDAARPSLGLAARAGLWVIPIDTVRWIHEAGLVSARRWRPSQTSLVRTMAARMRPEAVLAAESLVRTSASAAVVRAVLEPAQAVDALDLAAEWLQLDLVRGRVGIEGYRTRLTGVVAERARLALRSPVRDLPEPIPPHEGHDAARVALVNGIERDRRFAMLAWRPAFHGLEDDPAGFLAGGGIVFAEVELMQREGDPAQVHAVDLLRLRSLSEVDRFAAPVSWELGLGWRRRPLDDDDWDRHAFIEGGAGLSADIGVGTASLLAFAEIRADAEAMAANAGGAVRLSAHPTPSTGLLLQGRWTPGILGDGAGVIEAEGALRIYLDRQVQVGVDVQWMRAGDTGAASGAVVAAWHF